MKKLFYITTNMQWSGSEELWSRSAILFSNNGIEVVFSAPYQHNTLDTIGAKRLPYYRQTPSLLRRALAKLRLSSLKDPAVVFKEQLNAVKPDAVIISQGNNIDSELIMTASMESEHVFVTLTQLVTEFHFLFIDQFNLPRLQKAYAGARKNFFVSGNNLKLHNRMLGVNLNNTAIVYNPCKLRGTALPGWPAAERFEIALVGRLECYHKGYDLLLEVIGQNKWKTRNVSFNFYGAGPHLTLLQSQAGIHEIKNIVFKGQVESVFDIWKTNHLLIMPSRMEGQALSLIEAMYCQRAAVVTDVGGAGELITEGKNGFLAGCTVTSIDEAMERAWEVRHNWQALGMAAAASLAEKHPMDEVGYFNDELEKCLTNIPDPK